MSDVEEWEDHNESFRYDPPDKDPELWSHEEYTELYDRVIGRRQRWVCEKCSKPFGSLRKARRHVERQHADRLLQMAESRRESK